MMIQSIEISGFKCFQSKTVFPLGKLNLFTGTNGKGKSSVLQSLLLFRQSKEFSEDRNKLYLNGSCVQLGTLDDIKNSFISQKENISFLLKYSYTDQDFFVRYEFLPYQNDESVAQIQRSNHDTDSDKFFELEDKILKEIHYIAADRIGPQKYYDKYSPRSFVNVGPRGEYTANVLYQKEKELVNDLLYLGKDAKTLIQQTEEWLKKIFGQAKIEIKGKDKEHSVLNLLLNTVDNDKMYRSANVGFGYTYILPIIVSGLIAESGQILIVENPEAHLHPRAQSEIAKFLALVASCGVQVFIESHSEHILNGLRIASLSKGYTITNNDIHIFYFLEHEENGEFFNKLDIEQNGKIKNWPQGFFDQQEEDLREIFQLGRNIK
jgi:predicted ATPase